MFSTGDAMAVCRDCGLSISETATFCATCGASVLTGPAPEAQEAPPLPADDDWVPFEEQVAPPSAEPTSSLRSVASSLNGTSIVVAAIAVALAVILQAPSARDLPDALFLTVLWFAIFFVTMRAFGIGVTFIQLFLIAAICRIIGLALGLVFGPLIAHMLGPNPGLAALPIALLGLVAALLIEAEVITWVTEAEFLLALVVVIVAGLAGASMMYLLAMWGIYV